MVESGIIGQESIKGVLSGRFYNGSTRCHKIMHEALERIRFQTYLDSLFPEERRQINERITELNDAFAASNFNDMIESTEFQRIFDGYQNFIETQKSVCPTFALWSSYVDITGIFLFISFTLLAALLSEKKSTRKILGNLKFL